MRWRLLSSFALKNDLKFDGLLLYHDGNGRNFVLLMDAKASSSTALSAQRDH